MALFKKLKKRMQETSSICFVTHCLSCPSSLLSTYYWKLSIHRVAQASQHAWPHSAARPWLQAPSLTSILLNIFEPWFSLCIMVGLERVSWIHCNNVCEMLSSVSVSWKVLETCSLPFLFPWVYCLQLPLDFFSLDSELESEFTKSLDSSTVPTPRIPTPNVRT